MRQITVGKNDAGQTLRKFMTKFFPSMPDSLLHKYIRKKCVTRRREKLKEDDVLKEGDVLSFYISDEFFPDAKGVEKASETFRTLVPHLRVAYEDEFLLIADKPAGMIVHEDRNESRNTLINHVLAYLYRKGDYRPEEENAFAPALCNRIDRNTEGLVIAAKTAAALAEMNDMIKRRLVDKRYLAAVHGLFPDGSKTGEFHSYLAKDSETNTVRLSRRPSEGKTAVTRYRVLAENRERNLSLVEAELVTGRTHQIRAQFADAGHPLLGDGKYAVNREDRKLGYDSQALCSYRITFHPDASCRTLGYLSGKTVAASPPDFLSLFPDARLPE
ncbi:MAG: RluA family pseudouridine synthase [Clostridia bacterium]|nr:RluA family pseudouridine synthase [Clostridia bacterium]